MHLKSLFFLAAIPLLFAIQQFSEGLVWLQLTKHLPLEFFINTKKIFLLFAFVVWPVWIPLSLSVVEQVSWRRVVLYLNLACGIALSLLNLSYALEQNISVKIVNHSLQYLGQAPSQSLLYPLIVLLPCFVSSLKRVWIFGLCIVLGYVIADYFYATTFISVWCFFAALVSLFIYKVIKDSQVDLEKTPSNQ